MAKLLYGSYGHHPSGKQYVYFGGDNYRTGQNVVAPVTSPRTGKTYNTMFTIQRTSNVESDMAQGEISRLENGGIDIKTIGGRDVMNLPGASDWKSAKEWREWSNLTYEENIRQRLLQYQMPSSSNARNQLLSY